MAEESNPLDEIVSELVVFKHEDPNHPDGEYFSNNPLWADSRIRQHWLSRHSDAAVKAGEAKETGTQTPLVDEDEIDYNAMTNDELRAELVERGLSVDGKKADLVARLIQDDEDNPEE